MRGLSVFIIGVAIIAVAGLAYAEGEAAAKENKVQLGAYGMLVVPQKGNFDTTGGGGGYLRYFFTDNIAIEGAVEYAQWDFKTDVGGATGQLKGDLDIIPIMATLQYHFGNFGNYSTYVGGGFTGMVIDGEAKGTLDPGGNGKITFDDAIGGHICGGLDWKLSDNILFNLDAKYTWARSKTSESVDSGTLTFDDMDMYNFTLRGGITYKF
jgi:outer membrane protein